jgi:PII-like signaling protein
MTDNTQHGVHLRFLVHCKARHNGKLMSEWLLEEAKCEGISGGTAFRAIAGFGRHGVLHEEQFFELADDLCVKVEFLLSEEAAERFLQTVRASDPQLVYARSAVEFGVIGDTANKA